MASEITITTSISVTKNGITTALADTASTFDFGGFRHNDTIQEIGTSEEALKLGEITSPGWFYIKNLDATNFVTLRQATSAADFAKIKAGEHQLFRMAPGMTAPFALADTGACQVHMLLFED